MVVLVDRIKQFIRVNNNKKYLADSHNLEVASVISGRRLRRLLVSNTNLAMFVMFNTDAPIVYNFGRTIRRKDSLNTGLNYREFSLTDCTGYDPTAYPTLDNFFKGDSVTPRIIGEYFEYLPSFYPDRFTTQDGTILTNKFFVTLNELVPREQYFNADIPYAFIDWRARYSTIPIYNEGTLVGIFVHNESIKEIYDIKRLFDTDNM